MQDPITTIDLEHSSSPDNVAMPWEATCRVLETAEVFWLSTVRADGRPHVTPVAAAWLDGTLYFGTGASAQKLKNLRGNPHVVLTTGCNRLATGFDVVVEGDAAPVTGTGTGTGTAAAVHKRFHQQQAILWGEGWPIRLRDGLLGDETTEAPLLLFAVTPTKIFASARGDQWSQTRYQF